MLKRLNSVLPELLLGILIYGILAQLIGVWFVKDKIMYSAGLWAGVSLAAAMAVHMAVVIEDAVSLGSSQGRVIIMSLLRYGAAVLVFFCTAYFHLGDPMAVFVGVMGLKIAAYMQPSIHKAFSKQSKKKGCEEILENKNPNNQNPNN